MQLFAVQCSYRCTIITDHCTYFVWTSYRPGGIVFFDFFWLHSINKEYTHICSLFTQLSAPLIRAYTMICLPTCILLLFIYMLHALLEVQKPYQVYAGLKTRSHFLFCTWRFIINTSLNTYLANSASCLGSDRSMPGMPPGGSFFPVMYSE